MTARNMAKNKAVPEPIRPVIDNHLIYWFLAIILMTLLAFSNAFGNKFVNWDDEFYIYGNPLITDLSWNGLKAMFSSFYAGNYHPLVTLSNAIEYKFVGLDPFLYHLVNIFIHVANAVLVFLLIHKLTNEALVAGFVALFFAVHPMHVESVTWVSERKDVLYSCFYLTSLLFYMDYSKSGNKKLLLISLLFFILSLFSKSMAVTLPVLLCAFDYVGNKKFERRLLVEKIPFFICSLIFGIIAIKSQGGAENKALEVFANEHYHVWDRFLTVCYGFVYYIFQLFVPINLCAVHNFPAKTNGLLPFYYYFSPFALLLIGYYLYRNKTDKWMVFGFLFYVITLAVVAQLVPVGTNIVSERYSYIPYIGLLLVIGMFLKKYMARTPVKIGVTLLLAVCMLLTFQRNKVWKNSISFWNDVIEKYPKMSFAYNTRGTAFYENKNYEAALRDFDKAIQLCPGKLKEDLSTAYVNRGNTLYYLTKIEQACSDWKKAIELGNNSTEPYIKELCKP
jgi:hypothetical protein